MHSSSSPSGKYQSALRLSQTPPGVFCYAALPFAETHVTHSLRLSVSLLIGTVFLFFKAKHKAKYFDIAPLNYDEAQYQ